MFAPRKEAERQAREPSVGRTDCRVFMDFGAGIVGWVSAFLMFTQPAVPPSGRCSAVQRKGARSTRLSGRSVLVAVSQTTACCFTDRVAARARLYSAMTTDHT